jgi:hypothetical protein
MSGMQANAPKWLRSIALALEIAILLLLSLGGGNLRKYPHRKFWVPNPVVPGRLYYLILTFHKIYAKM